MIAHVKQLHVLVHALQAELPRHSQQVCSSIRARAVSPRRQLDIKFHFHHAAEGDRSPASLPVAPTGSGTAAGAEPDAG